MTLMTENAEDRTEPTSIRMPSTLKRALLRQAKQNRRSLTDEIIVRLDATLTQAANESQA